VSGSIIHAEGVRFGVPSSAPQARKVAQHEVRHPIPGDAAAPAPSF